MPWVRCPIRSSPRKEYRGNKEHERWKVREWNSISDKVISYINGRMENNSERVEVFYPHEIADNIHEPLDIVAEVVSRLDGGNGVTCYNGDYNSAVEWFNPTA